MLCSMKDLISLTRDPTRTLLQWKYRVLTSGPLEKDLMCLSLPYKRWR